MRAQVLRLGWALLALAGLLLASGAPVSWPV